MLLLFVILLFLRGDFLRHSILVTDEKYHGLNPVVFGFEDCEPGHAFGPAVRRYWLLHFVVTGFGSYQIGGKTYSVKPGEIFVIPPYEETFYKAEEENPWHYIWIGFTSDTELPVKLEDAFFCSKAFFIFNEMKKCTQMSSGRSAFLCARLWELFSVLLEKDEKQTDYIEDAVAYIHSEYMNDITVEQMARRLNLDRTYFSVLFKKRMGISPKQYLMNYRMKIAASLMTENKKSVSVAAHSVGYPDIFNFSKMFKRHYGLSPHEYVMKKQKEPQ